MEWSNDFCILYNCMLEIYRAYNPMPIGHFTTKHIEVGYSSFPIVTWIPDKEQPAGPTSVELLKRFTDLFADVTEGVTHSHKSYTQIPLARCELTNSADPHGNIA